MDKTLRCVGVCQDKNLDFSRPYLCLQWDIHTCIKVSRWVPVCGGKNSLLVQLFFFFLAKASVCAQDFRRVEQGVEERYQDPSHYKGAEDIHSALQIGCGVAGPALAHYLKEKSTKRHCAEI